MLLSFVCVRDESRNTAGGEAWMSTHVNNVVVSSFLLWPKVALTRPCAFLGLHLWAEWLNRSACKLSTRAKNGRRNFDHSHSHSHSHSSHRRGQANPCKHDVGSGDQAEVSRAASFTDFCLRDVKRSARTHVARAAVHFAPGCSLFYLSTPLVRRI